MVQVCQTGHRASSIRGHPDSGDAPACHYGTVTVARFESLLSTPLPSTAVTT